MCHRIIRCLVLVLLGLAALSMLPSAAAAADGVVKGRLQFYNNQGNYCPSRRDCTGARYLEADYNVNLPIPDVKVYVVAHDGAVLGSGTTDSNGEYTIRWFASTILNGAIGRIEWYGQHKDNRFNLRTSKGGRWVLSGSYLALPSGTTEASPQDLGTSVWGSASAPNALANLYDGALRTWRDSLNASNRMDIEFTNVEIRAFDASDCPTSCAYGASKQVVIDSTDSAFKPQGRIMHELGHVASYLSHPVKLCVDYTRDGSANGWNLKSAEHTCGSFEEGIATFIGDRAIYWASSPQPTTCISSSTCSTTDWSTEASTGAGTSCASGESRWALTTVRYLRDLYDTTNETNDTNSAPFGDFFDALAGFGDDAENRDANEPWSDNLSYLDDKDGRSARDFRAHFESLKGANTYSNFKNNCTPTGD
jgi:hypothetical protein